MFFPSLSRTVRSWLKTVQSGTGFRLLLLSALVGAVAGCGALAFYFATNAVDHFLLGQTAHYHPPVEGHLATREMACVDTLHMNVFWLLYLMPMVGGLFSGWLVYRYAPEAEGHGTDGALDAFHRRGGLIRGRVPLIKTLASIATIGTGGSAGREGPIAQIGAGFGSFVATRLGLTVATRRILLLAGMAGGIGATFRSPLGGALFAVEVLYRDPEFEHEGLIPSIISSITAYSLFGAVTGWEPLLATPHFKFEHPGELILYCALGLVCALFGAGYVKVFYGLRDYFKRLKCPAWLKPALGGLLLGGLAMLVPQVLGSGYGWVQAALYGKMTLSVMLIVAVAKIVATSLTISSGGSGGVFAPSLVIGAMLGGAFGAVAEHFFPLLTQDPQAYVLVGMAGFFAGVANAPIATLIMVSELTGNYGLLAPLMLVCVVAMIAMRRNGIYEKQVDSRIDSPAHFGDFVIDVLEGARVAELESKGREATLIPVGMTLPEVLHAISTAKSAYFPVVDDDDRMLGIFSLNDIRRILNEEIPSGLVVAGDMATRQVIYTTPDEALTDVMKKITSRNLEEIPVVRTGEPDRVLYMLSRRAVLSYYAEQVEKTRGQFQVS
nr:chloride channel protein [uncultured Desulfuromonas sp.]